MAAPAIEPTRHWLIVVELDDVVPRRDPSKPNLFVGLTLSPPAERFEQIKRSKRKTWYFGHVREFRNDLSPGHHFDDEGEARKELKLLCERLIEEGYAVNCESRVWQVYVLELDQARSKDSTKKPVYVGETSQDPETRLAQHRGELASKKGKPLTARSTKGYVIGLLPDLAPNQLYFTSEQSKRAEAEWAEHLRVLGYEVFGGH